MKTEAHRCAFPSSFGLHPSSLLSWVALDEGGEDGNVLRRAGELAVGQPLAADAPGVNGRGIRHFLVVILHVVAGLKLPSGGVAAGGHRNVRARGANAVDIESP